MYDLKNYQPTNETTKTGEINSDSKPVDIGDRGYYRTHLTDSVLYTKASYVPTESLF
ncbi:hypothetical protein [Clostridium manihotivorum]|uniref:hypothetical protein n=1 Tax=Clostridium manihotivorum TaxID=2320868 RepID=UPI0013E32DF6|nr:hypothetical protein [Clostridium manihotivorum]